MQNRSEPSLKAPEGAIKNFAQLRTLVHKGEGKIWLISNRYYYCINLEGSSFSIEYDMYKLSIWSDNSRSRFIFIETGSHVESATTGGFVFDNFWHAYAYNPRLMLTKASY